MNDFPHHRLDAFHAALDLARSARHLADRVTHGYRSLADQLFRSATSVALLVAEGANRRTPAQKRQRFAEARGECGEAAAAAEVLGQLGLLPASEADAFRADASRVAAMIAGLVRRFT